MKRKENFTVYVPDTLDIRILSLLQQDAKLTSKEIAAQLGLTTTPVYERIKRLEKLGFIEKYVALVNRKMLGKGLMAICLVQLNRHAKNLLEQFEQEVLKINEVIECFHIAGQFDYLIKVAIGDMNDYQNFIVNKLAAIDNVGNVQSSFVMKELINTTSVPLLPHKL